MSKDRSHLNVHNLKLGLSTKPVSNGIPVPSSSLKPPTNHLLPLLKNIMNIPHNRSTEESYIVIDLLLVEWLQLFQ